MYKLYNYIYVQFLWQFINLQKEHHAIFLNRFSLGFPVFWSHQHAELTGLFSRQLKFHHLLNIRCINSEQSQLGGTFRPWAWIKSLTMLQKGGGADLGVKYARHTKVIIHTSLIQWRGLWRSYFSRQNPDCVKTFSPVAVICLNHNRGNRWKCKVRTVRYISEGLPAPGELLLLTVRDRYQWERAVDIGEEISGQYSNFISSNVLWINTTRTGYVLSPSSHRSQYRASVSLLS